MDTSGAGSSGAGRLAVRAARYSGWDPQRMRDVDGDLQLKDSPFGVWVRLPLPKPGVLFVACPLIDFELADAARPILDGLVEGRARWVVAGGAIQLFRLASPEVLDDDEAFRREADGMVELGTAVVTAIQAAHGGLTGEQWRVIQGWCGRDEEMEATLGALVGEPRGTLVRHGWDPKGESLPLLVEESSSGQMVRRFATVDSKGAVRLRITESQVRGDESGFAFRLVLLEPKHALAWATRLGLAPKGKALTPEALQALQGRPWGDLLAPLGEVPHVAADAWKAVSRS